MAKAKAKTTLDTLKSIQEAVLAQQAKENNIRILVGMGTCGISAGAREVMEALKEELAEKNGCRQRSDRTLRMRRHVHLRADR
jgi:hypothetical protein